jgi:hypothetical protein
MFKHVMILDGIRYATPLCKVDELEDGSHYFMHLDGTNYIVQINYNTWLDRTIIVPKFVYGDIDNGELYRSSLWNWVRNGDFMELDSTCMFYKCEYLLNHDNVLNIDMDFAPEFM